MRFHFLVLVSFIVVGCTPEPSSDMSAENARHAIDQVHNRHVEAALAKDVDAFLNTVTDNFVIMPPNDPGARGKEAVRDWFNAIFGVFSIAELVFPTTEVNIDHDWAMRHYTYDWTLEPVAGGDSIRDKGDGLYIYHRGGDGEWRIAYDIWTSSEPLPGSE